MNALTDIELEQRAADGESEAFGVLYERYSPRVYDFLLRMVREPAEAADLMQETFVRAMRSLRAERAGKAEFATWLFTIARNLALTRLERSARTTPLATEGEEESFYYGLDPDLLDNPEAIAQASEIAALVWEASEALDPKQRTLLDLHVRQGLDSAEIATVLGVSKGNAYTMMSRLKDTFESAVTALVMSRAGRRDCPELNQLLEERGVTHVSPDVRKIIERHMQSCEVCQGKRRELVSAASLLRAFVPLPLMPDVASRIRESAWTAAQQAGPAGAAASSSGSAGGHSGGLLSAPARALHALPGPAWLPAIAAVLVVAVAVPAAVLAVRANGAASKDGAAAISRVAGSVAPTSAVVAVATAIVPGTDTISAGNTACVLKNGGVRCWGRAGSPPDAPDFASGVTAMSVRGATICAIKAGAVSCWGLNNHGQLGNNTTANSEVPVSVSGMSDGVAAVSAGVETTCAIKAGGAWCWGANDKGQLGNNSTTQSLVPVAVTGLSSGVAAISAGAGHTCALKDGGVWCWGQNAFGQLGSGGFTASLLPAAVPGMTSGVSAISVGTNATCAVKDGGAWCWGDNFNGQLSISRTDTCGGDPCSAVPLPVLGMESGVTAIDTDGTYTCALKDTAAWCWGDGHGITRTAVRAPAVLPGMESAVTAITVSGSQYTCALKDGDPWCWGINAQGQLGSGSGSDSISVPVKVVALAGSAGARASAPTALPSNAGAATAPGTDAERLRAAIRARSPGVGFDPECSAGDRTASCATGSWLAAMLASGIAGVSVHNGQEGVATFYGRMADGSWVYWFGTQNSGGPQVLLPGDMIVCADGDGLNLRADPSTSATVVTLIPDGTRVRGDRFVMTDPPSPGGGLPHADGWYHITSPREGWAFDRYLLAYANGVTTCIKTWWP